MFGRTKTALKNELPLILHVSISAKISPIVLARTVTTTVFFKV